jgi:hypothetical protein
LTSAQIVFCAPGASSAAIHQHKFAARRQLEEQETERNSELAILQAAEQARLAESRPQQDQQRHAYQATWENEQHLQIKRELQSDTTEQPGQGKQSEALEQDHQQSQSATQGHLRQGQQFEARS